MIVPTPFDTYVLAYRATMRDFRTYFVDAHSGAIVHVENEVDEQGAIVGIGVGVNNDRKKVSASPAGGGFQTYDRLRPAEIVTLDLRHADARVDSLLDPRGTRWVASDVAWDADNDWRDPAVVGAHVYGGFTYDYLFAQQGWRGMTGRDSRILSMVNIGRDVANAFFAPPPFGPEGTGVVAFGTKAGRHAHRVCRCRRPRDDARRDTFFGYVAHRKRSARHPQVRSRAVEFHLRRTDVPLWRRVGLGKMADVSRFSVTMAGSCCLPTTGVPSTKPIRTSSAPPSSFRCTSRVSARSARTT